MQISKAFNVNDLNMHFHISNLCYFETFNINDLTLECLKILFKCDNVISQKNFYPQLFIDLFNVNLCGLYLTYFKYKFLSRIEI